MKLDTFFARNAVFTIDDIDRFLSQETEGNRETRDALLRYHQERGKIVRVRRGLYASVPPGSNPAAFPVDPLLVASRLCDDAVLAYHTALEFHGIAQSLYNVHTVLSAQPLVRDASFQGMEYRAVMAPAALRRAGRTDIGVETRERSGLPLRVTGLERTLVNSLDRPELCGGWEEIWRSFQDAGYLDANLVADCALAMENDALAAKAGWFLERNAATLLIDPAGLDRLRERRPRQPRYLGRRSGNSRYIPEWNLIVPAEVADQAWGQVI